MDDPAADQALIAGILFVNPEQQREIVSILFERANAAGLNAIPTLFDKLDPTIQGKIISNTAKLGEALRLGIRSRNVHTRLNTLKIIRKSGNLQLAYLAAVAIHDGAAKVRAEAGITLRALADLHCRSHEETVAALRDVGESGDEGTGIARPVAQTLKLLQDERGYLVRALQEALKSYQSHHRSEVLEAAMYLADDLEEDLFQQETLKRGKLTHAAMELYTDTFSPRFAAFTYVAICYPELRRKIVAALANHKDPQFFAELIRHHWLARDPFVRKSLGVFKSLAFLQDGMEAAFALPADVAAMTPSWVLSLGLPIDQKVAILLSFLLIENAEANRAAVWGLVELDTPASSLALQSVLDHEEAALVKIAKRELHHRNRSRSPAIRQPRFDRPVEWSELLDTAGIAEDFEDLWSHVDHLHPVQVKKAGHHAFQYIPGFATQVRIKLMAANPADRLRAVRFINVLNVHDELSNELFAIANDPIAEVRAVAMVALGRIGGATSRRILERAINDESAAVQAAAIAALDFMNAPGRDILILPKAHSEDADTRAAAIRALLKLHVSDAANALISMLHDPRPDHRCAALWVVDELRLVTLLSRVWEICRIDQDDRISRIAEHVAKRLERYQSRAKDRKPAHVEAPTS